MRALARLPPGHALAAMQAINLTVIQPLFMSVFLGTALWAHYRRRRVAWNPLRSIAALAAAAAFILAR